VLKKARGLTSYGAYRAGKLVGYVTFNPVSKRIHQFGVDKDHRRQKIASSLFNFIGNSGNIVSTINVEEGSVGTNAFLEKTGMKKFVEQFEMEMDLK
jgi:hypothetical protein